MRKQIVLALRQYLLNRKEQAEDSGKPFSFENCIAGIDMDYFLHGFLCYEPSFKIEVLKTVLDIKEEEL